MKIFIAGPRAITELDSNVRNKLFSICEKGYDVLVGDATGVDSSVQRFYADKAYNQVTVFAGNGEARNNVGNWKVENVAVEGNRKNFDFYVQKDIAMANQADYGFMIWNGESKGTLNNIVNLLEQNKSCLVYLVTHLRFFSIDCEESCLKLISLCPESAKVTYNKLTKRKAPLAQMAIF